MKFDLTPARSVFVTPAFGDDDDSMDPELARRLRRPMKIGAAVIAVFVVGLGLWAAFTSFDKGVMSPAEVRTDAHRNTLRAPREGGTVKQILVSEGQMVRAGQPLLRFNDVETRAAFDVFQNQHDVLTTQNVRFAGEAAGQSSINFPLDLTARGADPRISTLIHDQEFLFSSRLQLFQSQSAILAQRADQLDSQLQGLQAQVTSNEEQTRLMDEELDGFRELNAKGFASTNLIRGYERTLAEYAGLKGQLSADIARTHQQKGEVRLQLTSLRDERQTRAAEGLRDAQSRLADVVPRLAAAKQAFDATVVRAPVDGYVFNLSQFTVGGVVGGNELLMDVVPSGAPLTVMASVNPRDIEEVYEGQSARVRLTGLNMRFNEDLKATVTVVGRDRMTEERTGEPYYRVDLRIDPAEVAKLRRGVELTPGMPAQAIIVTGDRTVLGFLISPITDTVNDAFREE